MKKLMVGVLFLSLWPIIPHLSRAEGFLYLPINRTVVITAGFCGYRTLSGRCHGGIDYDTRDDGDGIFAAAAGTVEVVVDNRPNTRGGSREYGNYVQILHDNGYLTIYGHLKSGTLAVRVGDRVRAGSLLGIGDNSGWSTGSHLHFEVRDPSGRRVDPCGESPSYPNCGENAPWVTCPPLPPHRIDNDCDGYIDDFCLCEIARPHPSCLCRMCDAPCPSGFYCLVISMSPFTYGCYWRGGCYGCPGMSGIEDWVCSSHLYCVENATLEYCLHPDAYFCGGHCPLPW
jgi:murein DD-endopeptidase MepM/ murein hydrolase activator NlpD